MDYTKPLRLRGFAGELVWVPAPLSIDGSEAADESAKEATGRRLKKLGRGGRILTKESSALVIQMRTEKSNFANFCSQGKSPQLETVDASVDKETGTSYMFLVRMQVV